jgi:multidrug efflux pump subunit AcrA (membrane-fusion protein)
MNRPSSGARLVASDPTRHEPRLSALSLAQTPLSISRIATACVWAVFLTPLLMLLLPWVQNIQGYGEVMAFLPNERQQTVDSPVSGRVLRWHVREGTEVKKGDLLAEVADIDPEVLGRLEGQRGQLEAKIRAKEEELSAYRLQLAQIEAARDLQVGAARQRLDASSEKARGARESVASAEASLAAATVQEERMRRLLGSGVVSRRDVEVAQRDAEVARRNLNSARANLRSAQADLGVAGVEVDRTRTDAQARVESASATANKTAGELAEARQSMLKLEVDLARQRAQDVHSPQDGMVYRIVSQSDAQVLKQGDPLLVLVPDTAERGVALLVAGNDAPLIKPGRKVRLQFEGWPAIQFGGWPYVGVGSFAGQVSFVDPTDDGKGKFRVMVIPDPAERGGTWPDAQFLRQGSQARGWILLDRVRLGYEVWRQLNGFPPRLPDDKPKPDVARKRVK